MTFLCICANVLVFSLFENVSDSRWHVTHCGRHDSDILCLCGNESSNDVRSTNDAAVMAPHLFLCPSQVQASLNRIIFTLSCPWTLISSPAWWSTHIRYDIICWWPNGVSLRREPQHSHWILCCRSLVGMLTWVFGLRLILPRLVWFDSSHIRSS